MLLQQTFEGFFEFFVLLQHSPVSDPFGFEPGRAGIRL